MQNHAYRKSLVHCCVALQFYFDYTYLVGHPTSSIAHEWKAINSRFCCISMHKHPLGVFNVAKLPYLLIVCQLIKMPSILFLLVCLYQLALSFYEDRRHHSKHANAEIQTLMLTASAGHLDFIKLTSLFCLLIS